jgi:hypothetical protein
MLSNSQKEHLTYTAVWQVFTLVILGILAFQYIIPQISAVNSQLTKTNVAIEKYRKTVDQGLDYASLGNLLSSKPERAELIKIIQTDPRGTEAVIKKTGSKNYLDWLNQSIGDSDEDKKILVREKGKLNSIIPTMSPISSNIEESNISLKDYVKFIEGTILKQFNFDSNVVISMQGVSFGSKWGNTPENVGTLDFRFDFKGTNSDIKRFIEYVNTAWKPDILTSSGIQNESQQIPNPMSNPLITMSSFSLQNILDGDDPNGQNSGRANLRFYIRWLSKDDLLYLRENLKSKQEEIGKKLEESLKWCEKDGVICAGYKTKLTQFEIKYREFRRSISTIKTTWDDIYAMTQLANTLKSLEKELDSILPKDKK